MRSDQAGGREQLKRTLCCTGKGSLALCPQVVTQAPQHFRSSETQASCDGCFARQSICSVVSLHSGMSRAVHPQEFSKVNVDH